jgi:hypothetical protein
MSNNPPDPVKPKSSPIGGNVWRIEELERVLRYWPPYCRITVEVTRGESEISMDVMEKEEFRASMHTMVDNMIAGGFLEPMYETRAKAAIDNEIDIRMEQSRSTQ